MTNKEIDMILAKTMYVFSWQEAIEIYVHIQAYRRALTYSIKRKISFLEAIDAYIIDIYLPIIEKIKHDKKLKKIVKKYGLSYAYLIITECLISSKRLTLNEMLERVSLRTEDLKKRIAA